jgi:hypothetical protein
MKIIGKYLLFIYYIQYHIHSFKYSAKERMNGIVCYIISIAEMIYVISNNDYEGI